VLKKFSIFTWIFAIYSLAAATQGGSIERFSFINNDHKISSSGGLKGKYTPSNDPDNDTPETRNPKRYRVKGKIDQALRFYRTLGSYVKVDGFKMPAKREKLYLSAIVKPIKYQIGVIISCKTDSNRNGFALFVWGREWRFQYGDGTKSYTAKFKDDPYKGGWKFVEIFFNKGTVECKINGNSIGSKKFPGQIITTNSYPLFLGNYPSQRARMRYAFNGMIDELIIAGEKTQANVDFSQKMVKKLPALEAICEPVEGNEIHFGGIKKFHTFKKYPVPLNFKFRGDPKGLKNPQFSLYLPENISLLEAFQSNHNCPDEPVKMNSNEVIIDGQKYRQYTTPENYDFAYRLTRRYRAGKIITCALGQAGELTAGKIYWSVVNDGKESKKHPVVVKFIEPLTPAKAGKFMIMNFFIARDIAYHKPENFKKIAQLYKLSGMTGKGRSYKSHKRRCKLDNQLLKDGFTLYEISLWYGPLRNKTLGGPLAVDSKGKKSDKYLCPTALVASEEAMKKYEQAVKRRISVGKTQWAALDYEPWGKPTKLCFCRTCLASFKNKFGIKENNLTASLVKRKYKDQWARYWVENSALIIKMMSDALRKADPNIKVVEYTYFFQYNDPKALNRRWWSIPKDPRLNEKYLDESMLSMYHANGRKAFDLLNLSLNTLKKPVSVIASLSRANDSTGSYTTKEEALSPQQMRQKAVMCAALGVKTFGLWPGTCIDGMYHLALGRACRDIWKYEDYYFFGKRVDKLVSVVPVKALHRSDYAYTAWAKNGKILVTLFNFSRKPVKLKVGESKKIISVPADGYIIELL
jgi:Concanavalin A-like lectin/glucanases superfamily